MFNKEEKELFDLYYKNFKDVFKYYVDFLNQFENLQLNTKSKEKQFKIIARNIYYNILLAKNVDFWKYFNLNQKTALISLIYDIGLGEFDNSDLLKYIYANPRKLEANKNLINSSWKKWNKISIDGKEIVSNKLSLRRKLEINKFWS